MPIDNFIVTPSSLVHLRIHLIEEMNGKEFAPTGYCIHTKEIRKCPETTKHTINQLKQTYHKMRKGSKSISKYTGFTIPTLLESAPFNFV